MRIELSSKLDQIPVDKDCWNTLVKNNMTNTVFQTYEWFHNWWNNYGQNYQLVFLTAYDDKKITGFVPLMLQSQGINRKVLHFVGDSNADYCDFIIGNNRIKTINAFLDYLYTCELKWHSILLLNIPDYSDSLACLQTICYMKKRNIQIKSPVPTPTLVIKNHISEARNSINKYSIKRHFRKLEKIGSLSFKNFRDKNDIMQHIDMFFDQHIKRYQLKDKESQFNNTVTRKFYIDLVEKLCDTNQVLFSVLMLDNRAIAYHFGFDYNNRIIWYKPSFDTNYKEYSPGTILLKYLIEYAIDTNHSELDFTIGDESFKNRFCNRIRYNQNISINRSKIMHVICTFRQYMGYLAQRISRTATYK